MAMLFTDRAPRLHAVAQEAFQGVQEPGREIALGGFGGTSGSPVFSGNDNYIIGGHTNGLHDGEPWRSNNAFTRITPERLREIVSWVND